MTVAIIGPKDCAPPIASTGIPSLRPVDSLGDPWFALNNDGKSRVVDVYSSQTAGNSQIDAWTWNGGDNQWWRVEIY